MTKQKQKQKYSSFSSWLKKMTIGHCPQISTDKCITSDRFVKIQWHHFLGVQIKEPKNNFSTLLIRNNIFWEIDRGRNILLQSIFGIDHQELYIRKISK